MLVAGVTQNLLSCWKSNANNKVICMVCTKNLSRLSYLRLVCDLPYLIDIMRMVCPVAEMKAVMLAMQWLPLFSVLFLIGWMSRARASRRSQFRRKKVSKRSLV